MMEMPVYKALQQDAILGGSPLQGMMSELFEQRFPRNT
jgi:hypothetical protein